MKEYRFFSVDADLGLLLVRAGVGAGFLAHGLQKLQGMEGTVSFFGSLGLPPAMAWLVALIETLGGAAMILGLWTHMAGLLLSAVMIGAIMLVKMKKGYLAGYELESLYLFGSLGIAFAGAGKHTLAALLGGKKGKEKAGTAAPPAQPQGPATG
jgi:uncharacterized membrane protein YphA (DoxX/SURF4 family)